MVNYTFGVLSDLTDAAVSNAIPSIVPVNQHVSVVDNQVVIHPTIKASTETDSTFAVTVAPDATNDNRNVPVVPTTVIQDASTSPPVPDASAIVAQLFFNPHPSLNSSTTTTGDIGVINYTSNQNSRINVSISSPTSLSATSPLTPSCGALAPSTTTLSVNDPYATSDIPSFNFLPPSPLLLLPLLHQPLHPLQMSL